jgi:hypothetical protein
VYETLNELALSLSLRNLTKCVIFFDVSKGHLRIRYTSKPWTTLEEKYITSRKNVQIFWNNFVVGTQGWDQTNVKTLPYLSLTSIFSMKISARRENCDSRAWWISASETLAPLAPAWECSYFLKLITLKPVRSS